MMKSLLILILIAIAGCKGKQNVVETVPGNNREEVHKVSGDNEEMNAAMEEAVRNYPLFLQALQQPDSSLTDFAVKMKFPYGGNNVEHMWVNGLHMIGGQLFGVLNSEPMHIESVKLGDTLRVARDEISDWMYVKDGKLQGGYTLKVLYRSVGEKEKKELRESVPFEIE